MPVQSRKSHRSLAQCRSVSSMRPGKRLRCGWVGGEGGRGRGCKLLRVGWQGVKFNYRVWSRVEWSKVASCVE